jgi:hypothetical protein
MEEKRRRKRWGCRMKKEEVVERSDFAGGWRVLWVPNLGCGKWTPAKSGGWLARWCQNFYLLLNK